ncbi:unnamed protein product [Brassica oleracea var. botrytis]|nr:hypothetical protein HID58_060197 [Brassica napus]CAF1838394.1 unnamed protein product [Brassica napus]VDD08851.1 unnamed protein product [Brassica oleracea]
MLIHRSSAVAPVPVGQKRQKAVGEMMGVDMLSLDSKCDYVRKLMLIGFLSLLSRISLSVDVLQSTALHANFCSA